MGFEPPYYGFQTSSGKFCVTEVVTHEQILKNMRILKILKNRQFKFGIRTSLLWISDQQLQILRHRGSDTWTSFAACYVALSALLYTNCVVVIEVVVEWCRGCLQMVYVVNVAPYHSTPAKWLKKLPAVYGERSQWGGKLYSTSILCSEFWGFALYVKNRHLCSKV